MIDPCHEDKSEFEEWKNGRMKKHPKLYKETMTTEEVIQVVDTINSPLAASKWLGRNKITAYPINSRVSVWDRSQVMKCLTPPQTKK